MGQEMGQITKPKKGKISIENNGGRIRLRWRHEGKRYPLSLPYAYTPENMHYAKVKAAEIKLDIMKGCFDTTLEQYRIPTFKTPPTITGKKVENQPIQTINESIDASNCIIHLRDLQPLFNYWVTNIRSLDLDNTSYYFNAEKLLVVWEGLTIDDVPEKLNSLKFAPTTYNDRLTCLRSFFA